MKIDLKLTHEAITIIASTLQPIYKSKAHTRREKSTLSIAYDVAGKLDSKFGSVKLKTDLFNTKKKVKVSLKYHEADMLELLLLGEIKGVSDNYIRQQIQKVINELNQKLA
ncbi:hypothetical protein GCM10008015_26630 [Flavobacterium palustre]|uniref:Four helix bundle protein n=1 Tax=Flavobacterium palustre TaxID=1476463 RepID=A0ABQ1HPU1_9FLAO|nr:hypothetical protein [Flavobacterium palustre]GGA84511.1 hypothetical protein GCM10008015_26630 [Flavobacterium palustre]